MFKTAGKRGKAKTQSETGPPYPPEQLRRFSQKLEAFFPAECLSMESARVVLLDLDPRHIHVYWHIPVTSAPAGLLSLRIHDLAYMDLSGSNPHACLELFVAEIRGERSLPMPEGRTLRAEIGLPGPCRAFSALARSDILRLPPARPCLYPTPSADKPLGSRILQPSFPLIVSPHAPALQTLSLCAGDYSPTMPALAAARTNALDSPAEHEAASSAFYDSGAGVIGKE